MYTSIFSLPFCLLKYILGLQEFNLFIKVEMFLAIILFLFFRKILFAGNIVQKKYVIFSF